MMILFSLRLQNFKKYRDFTLDFEEGLTGIIGRNGSGKSTLFEAVLFALYGESKGAKENLKNAQAGEKENVIVELTCEIDTKMYRVTRELRGKSLAARAKLFDSADVLISDGAREVTIHISKLIGMSKEAFLHTVFASQKELTSLGSLKNEERKKIIRKLLGLDKIDKIEEMIKAMLTDLNRDIKSFLEVLLSDEALRIIENEKAQKVAKLQEITAQIAATTKEHESKSKEIEISQKTLDAFVMQKDAHLALEKDLSLLLQEAENIKNLTRATHEKYQNLQEKQTFFEQEKHHLIAYEKLEIDLKTYQAQKEKLLQKEGLEKEQAALRVQYNEAKEEMKSLSEKLKNKAHLEAQKNELQEKLKTEITKVRRLEEEEKALRDAISRYKGQIDDAKTKIATIQSLGRESHCPTCTRALLDAYDDVLFSLQTSIQNLFTHEIQGREVALKALELEKSTAEFAQKAHEKTLQEIYGGLKVLEDVAQTLAKKEKDFGVTTQRGLTNKEALEKLGETPYDEKCHADALGEKARLEPVQKTLIGTQSLIAQMPMIEKELALLSQKGKALEEKISEKKEAIKAHAYDAKSHQEAANTHLQRLKAKDALMNTLRSQERHQEMLKGEIKSLETQIATNDRQKMALVIKQNDKNDYEKLKLLMGAFKNKINSRVAPRISQLASDMYKRITRGKYQHIEVDEAFDFYIYDEGVRYPIERFSGGEIDLANLVLRIAISKTLSELNGSGGVGFLAFDEVFGSQDEERRMEIMEAFHTIKEQYRQIFLISHEREIKEMFERVVEL